MNCPNCGNNLPDTAKFCDKCGAGTSIQNATVDTPEPQQSVNEELPEAVAESVAEIKPKAANSKRNIIILFIVLAVLVVGTVAAVLAIGSDEGSDVAGLLDSAERYLSEANYEQAIFEFDKVLAIEPTNVSAYLGKANAYISAGDIAKAVEVLKEGYAVTGSEEIKAKLDELTADSGYDGGAIQHAPGFTYGDARCIEIEQMLLHYINGTGELDTAALSEVSELAIYGDSCVSVICGNKGGTDASDISSYTMNGDAADISFVKHLTNAVAITIEGSPITDLSPLSALTGLKRLSLFGSCTIKDITPLGSLTSLTHLDLGVAAIEDISALAGLTSLVSLDLNSNSISDISAISALTELTYLDVGGNDITDISAVAGLTKLTHLNASINGISDISAVQGLTELRELYLWDNDISQTGALASLTKLERLYVEYNRISDVSAIKGLTGLKRLYILGNDISDADKSALQQALPDCRIM